MTKQMFITQFIAYLFNQLKKTTTMKFRFTKNGQSISKAEFERNVPTNWANQLDEFGCFSWGYFRATLID